MPSKNLETMKPVKKTTPLIRYLSLPFIIIYTCFLKSFLMFKSQMRLIKKKSKPSKKYHRITFNTNNNSSQELAKLNINSAKSHINSENSSELFSPNLNQNLDDFQNNQNVHNGKNSLNDTIISIITEEKKTNDNCYQKVLNNIGKGNNTRRHIVFQKIVFGNGNNVMKKKGVMPGTDSALTKYKETNKKFIDELKPHELLAKSKELEETLMERLHQPIILRNKKLVIKSRPKKKSFVPSNLTTIYEDLDYC